MRDDSVPEQLRNRVYHLHSGGAHNLMVSLTRHEGMRMYEDGPRGYSEGGVAGTWNLILQKNKCSKDVIYREERTLLYGVL